MGRAVEQCSDPCTQDILQGPQGLQGPGLAGWGVLLVPISQAKRHLHLPSTSGETWLGWQGRVRPPCHGFGGFGGLFLAPQLTGAAWNAAVPAPPQGGLLASSPKLPRGCGWWGFLGNGEDGNAPGQPSTPSLSLLWLEFRISRAWPERFPGEAQRPGSAQRLQGSPELLPGCWLILTRRQDLARPGHEASQVPEMSSLSSSCLENMVTPL